MFYLFRRGGRGKGGVFFLKRRKGVLLRALEEQGRVQVLLLRKNRQKEISVKAKE